jgi:TrpR family trp operon transcriptional repressor
MDKAVSELAQMLAQIQDRNFMEGFLREMLTPSELRALSLRWELLKLLDAGVSQREIARELGVSLCKITRGSREMKKRGSFLKRALQRVSAAADQKGV